MAKIIKPIITFTEDVFPYIRKMLGMKNLICYYCKKKITKQNVGGLLTKEVIICRDYICMLEAIEEGYYYK